MARLMRRVLTRRIAGALGLVALAIAPSVAWAHPIHTTLSVVSTSATGVLTIRIRAFADDFSAIVATHAGRAAPADSSAPVDLVARYVSDRFMVWDASGHQAKIELCGIERARELYWVCVRALAPHNAKILNLMLTELHPDQVNIVQLEGGSVRKTLLFTKGASAASLP